VRSAAKVSAHYMIEEDGTVTGWSAKIARLARRQKLIGAG
jgi:N-acetyl-anhydromuramyl-L-alanine amidase AmpD